MQLRYALVRFYEDKKDLPSAQTKHRSDVSRQPKILGVVRSTVDFYWRVKQYPEAIAVLRQAAKDAYPQLSAQFTFEAARKSTEFKDFQQARALLDGLLKDSPFDAQYLAAWPIRTRIRETRRDSSSSTWRRLALFRNAPLTLDERKNRVATLRRGLIPALTQLKDYAGRVDQYIEVLNNFPEDEGLATEAALYAHGISAPANCSIFTQRRFSSRHATIAGPWFWRGRSLRWKTFPAAIDSYGKAITIRPDRTDLSIAARAFEERLLR